MMVLLAGGALVLDGGCLLGEIVPISWIRVPSAKNKVISTESTYIQWRRHGGGQVG